MSHILGVYWAPEHMRQGDIAYITALQSPAIRILEADASTMNRAHAAAPHALLLPRDWALSEQHDDVRRDPVGTGIRHAQDWRGKLDKWRSQGMKAPDSQIVVVGINEPRVWDMLPETVAYNVAFLDECARLGLRACALNLSVGWPANTGTDTPPDWTPYAPIQDAIKRGNHVLVCHEYWYASGPQDGASWWAWRINRCPWDVPIIIGECGVDNYVDMERWRNDGNAPRGWHGNIGAEAYADQVTRYARGLDKRVVAILPFLTDYRSNTWESFDTFAAHGALLARRHQMQPQAQSQVFIPSIPNKPVGNGDGNWSRAYPHVLKIEGGLSLDPNDPGNYYNGQLVGTKYGISAAVWGGRYDIRNLTEQQALAIYHEHYWRASGADKMPWPLCLIHFDCAVNAGVYRAEQLRKEAGDDWIVYLVKRRQWYQRLDTWKHYGVAWSNRLWILLEAAVA